VTHRRTDIVTLRATRTPGRLVGLTRNAIVRSVAFALLVLVAACGPNEPLKVSAVQTGKSLNSDNSIAVHAATFRPKDTMYVAVLTDARGAGKITVRWKLGSQVLQELTREVSYNDQAATDFRFQAADGFPAGTYTIEVLLDGQSVNTTTVRVET